MVQTIQQNCFKGFYIILYSYVEYKLKDVS